VKGHFGIFCLLLLALPSAIQAGYFQTTTTWLARCQIPIQEPEKQNSNFVKVADELSPCYAYLMAIADAVDATLDEAGKSVLTDRLTFWQVKVCMPRSAVPEGLRQAFIEFAKSLPEITGTNPAYVIADAYASKWPCAEE